MSLEEFINDETFGGGNWADAEVDMASIAVPTGGTPSYHHYNVSDGFNSYSGRGGAPSVPDLGPPYIIKLLNLPITVNDSFIEDLFRSRYTTYVKFKIAVDPASNILETHVIKKVAFVELGNFADFQKVTKWQDLYYKQNRKVVVEMADFADFQSTIKFNNDYSNEIAAIEEEFAANKNNPRFQENDRFQSSAHGAGPHNKFGSRTMGRQQNLQPPIHSASPTLTLPASHVSNPPLKPKSNPFGNAKPVDTLSKQQEIEKKLINLNNTTVQTLGDDTENIDVESTIKKFHDSASPRSRRTSAFENRRPSVSILKRPQDLHDTSVAKPKVVAPEELSKVNSKVIPAKTEADSKLKKLSPAPVPENGYPQSSNGKSLAELLAEKPDNKANGKGANKTVKTPTAKPVVLKKKVTPQAELDLTRKESDLLAEEEYRKRDEELKKLEAERRKAVEDEVKKKQVEEEAAKKVQMEDKLKKINASLSKTKMETNEPTLASEPETKITKPQAQKVERVEEDRPDFKKQLNEIVNKSQIPREKRNNSHENRSNQGESYRGGYNNRGRHFKNQGYNSNFNRQTNNRNNDNRELKQGSQVETKLEVEGPKTQESSATEKSYSGKSSNANGKQSNNANGKQTNNSTNGKQSNANGAKLSNIASNDSTDSPKNIRSKSPVKKQRLRKKDNEESNANGKSSHNKTQNPPEEAAATGDVPASGKETTISSEEHQQHREIIHNDESKSDAVDGQRGDGSGSKGRGRGNYRGSGRGRGSSRGRGGRGSVRNFNLHYVRSKPEAGKLNE